MLDSGSTIMVIARSPIGTNIANSAFAKHIGI
jgi:hypothetical protein